MIVLLTKKLKFFLFLCIQYTLKKGDFIRGVLKKAGFDRLRVFKCNDEIELDSAKILRQKYFSEKNIEDKIAFSDTNHTYLNLYSGVKNVGYADLFVVYVTESVIDLFFMSVMKEWAEFHGCELRYCFS